MGELLGIYWYRPTEVSVKLLDSQEGDGRMRLTMSSVMYWLRTPALWYTKAAELRVKLDMPMYSMLLFTDGREKEGAENGGS